MSGNDKINKGIIESAIVIIITALFIVYGKNVFPILMIFIPLPFIVLGIKNGIKNNIIGMVITSLIIGLILKSPGDMILLLMFAPLSIGLNYFIKNKKKTGETIIFSTLIMFISFLVIILLAKQSTGIGLTAEFEQFYGEILTMQQDLFKDMGLTNHQILERMNILETGYEYMMMTLPSILIIMSAFISFINNFVSSKILKKIEVPIDDSFRFSRFNLPNNVIIGTGFMFLVSIIMGKLEVPYHNTLLANISLLAGFTFLLQGLSVVDFFLIRFKMNLFIRVIILIVLTFIPVVGSILILLGMIDIIFDMRKIGRRKSL